ncbi:MAG: hypothetical protein WC137_02320 [Alphaproteobacteria bacterium]
MRVWTSFTLISALLATDALAVSMTTNNRSRPGSVSGAMLSNAQSQISRANTSGTTSSTTTSSTTSTTTTTTTDEDDCGEVLPLLGVNKCVAKTACTGIKADGHSGVFNEETSTCQIPVCAHNWSGVIQKDDEDVCALVDMNKAITCNADLFDQIDNMRRSSQWVVPLTVVGGAGIGTGIGALVDKKQNAKAENLASIADTNEAEVKATGGKTVEVTFAGTKYKLPSEADALKKALLGNNALIDKINNANGLIDNCAAQMFVDITSKTVNGKPKWGRIKITDGSDCTSQTTDKVKYCQFQNMNTTSNAIADCAGNVYIPVNFNNPYPSSAVNPSERLYDYGSWTLDATCYFRDSQGSGEADVSATIQEDWARMQFLQNYVNVVKADDSQSRIDLQNKLRKFDFNNAGFADSQKASNYNILNWVYIKSFDDKTQFSSIPSQKCDTDAVSQMLNTTSEVATNNATNILFEAYGALYALKGSGSLDAQLEALLIALGNIETFSSDVLTIYEGLGEEIRKDLGKKRPFFKTAMGRGLIIGAGVGAVAGVGYWFAEGSSTFCNVGGLEQVKLKKSYSIPSFHDYLYEKGLIQ